MKKLIDSKVMFDSFHMFQVDEIKMLKQGHHIDASLHTEGKPIS